MFYSNKDSYIDINQLIQSLVIFEYNKNRMDKSSKERTNPNPGSFTIRRSKLQETKKTDKKVCGARCGRSGRDILFDNAIDRLDNTGAGSMKS